MVVDGHDTPDTSTTSTGTGSCVQVIPPSVVANIAVGPLLLDSIPAPIPFPPTVTQSAVELHEIASSSI